MRRSKPQPRHQSRHQPRPRGWRSRFCSSNNIFRPPLYVGNPKAQTSLAREMPSVARPENLPGLAVVGRHLFSLPICVATIPHPLSWKDSRSQVLFQVPSVLTPRSPEENHYAGLGTAGRRQLSPFRSHVTSAHKPEDCRLLSWTHGSEFK